MSKSQLEKKYDIMIEEKDNILFVYNAKTKILLFLAPNLYEVDKSMQYLAKTDI